MFAHFVGLAFVIHVLPLWRQLGEKTLGKSPFSSTPVFPETLILQSHSFAPHTFYNASGEATLPATALAAATTGLAR